MVKVTVGNNLKRVSVIVPAETTLKSVLEHAEIRYETGIMTLDGAPLAPGDLEKTFSEFGITEKCYLLSIVKADNAAEIYTLGRTALIRSNLKLDDVLMCAKYCPDALCIRGEDGEDELFRIGVSVEHGDGELSKYGILFDPESTSGYAEVTIPLEVDEDFDNVYDPLFVRFGAIIENLEAIEQKIPEELSNALKRKDVFINKIHVN